MGGSPDCSRAGVGENHNIKIDKDIQEMQLAWANSWAIFKAETSHAVDGRVAQAASMAAPNHQSGQKNNVAQSGPVFTNVNCPTAPPGIDPNFKKRSGGMRRWHYTQSRAEPAQLE